MGGLKALDNQSESLFPPKCPQCDQEPLVESSGSQHFFLGAERLRGGRRVVRQITLQL
jgi:hypothetical protein